MSERIRAWPGRDAWRGGFCPTWPECGVAALGEAIVSIIVFHELVDAFDDGALCHGLVETTRYLREPGVDPRETIEGDHDLTSGGSIPTTSGFPGACLTDWDSLRIQRRAEEKVFRRVSATEEVEGEALSADGRSGAPDVVDSAGDIFLERLTSARVGGDEQFNTEIPRERVFEVLVVRRTIIEQTLDFEVGVEGANTLEMGQKALGVVGGGVGHGHGVQEDFLFGFPG